MLDAYRILGLTKSATAKEVRSAYKALVLRWHPDRCSAPEAAKRIDELTKAKNLLLDPIKRNALDLHLQVKTQPRKAPRAKKATRPAPRTATAPAQQPQPPTFANLAIKATRGAPPATRLMWVLLGALADTQTNNRKS